MHRIAATHSSTEKAPNRCLPSSRHHGLGGIRGNALGPLSWRTHNHVSATAEACGVRFVSLRSSPAPEAFDEPRSRPSQRPGRCRGERTARATRCCGRRTTRRASDPRGCDRAPCCCYSFCGSALLVGPIPKCQCCYFNLQ